VFGSSGAVMLLIAAALPFFFFAMYEKNGQSLEKILKNYINVRIKRPKIRPYKTDNFYSVIMKQNQLDKEVDKIAGHKET
ncbi:MAG: PrgI family protein, partial [Christensenella sp.]